MVIIAKYGFSTTIPALSFKSSSEVTINAAALDEEISFLNLGKNANVIDLFEADFKSSTVEIAILPSPINFPFTLSANSLRVIKC